MSNLRQNLPVELAVLSVARDFIGLQEIGNNRGPAVEFFQKLGGSEPGAPWCASFVNACAEIGCALKNVYSPFEKIRPDLQDYVQAYVDYGRDNDWEITFAFAFPGCIGALWKPSLDRFAHLFFVDEVYRVHGKFRTVEGNTNAEGGREGIEVASLTRSASDRIVFFDWTKGLE
ncbi:MAG: hypothetical protein AMJ65_15535 [Phycisphaerae bacterium SG8_4]|nr:MAG: hypothetical protein AMJ65_15535 [Phycisphaerae bacterium SG8_4]